MLVLIHIQIIFEVNRQHHIFLELDPWNPFNRQVIVYSYINRKNPKYWDRLAWANSVDPDQMLQNAASDQGLHWLPLIQHYFRHINM